MTDEVCACGDAAADGMTGADGAADVRNSRDARDDLDVRDPQPPLEMLGEREVFREAPGGADFRVTAAAARVRATGQLLTLHMASVKGGRPGAVCVAVLGDAGDVGEPRYLLARHWRATTGEWEWEFPRGMGEPGETMEATAAREFAEETGIVVDERRVTVLQTMHADTGMLRDVIAVARIDVRETDLPEHAVAGQTVGEHNATGQTVGEQDAASRDGANGTGTNGTGANRVATDWELDNLRWVTARGMRTLIARGDIVDGITLAAYAVAAVASDAPTATAYFTSKNDVSAR
ncbi:NUDIX hydrolase [Bifidobacterium saguinibicoloris]|uniref:NUDIX hydrolase n=1 Tax=Bifidobacterium saguinibicoloris TaxID=2834433 RepID=UPI001C59DCFA|nr:NUDIX hydrolase [Bifidobacterium saguinibicoloris]MBW3081360.1 NUDIX hydrolase [Bifidobacterium saguinibicoloris]